MNAKMLYDDLADELCERAGVEPSTMMGYPCLRRDGTFFASWDHKDSGLIVKVPAARVDALIEAGVAAPFSPNGRRFREWAVLTTADEAIWRDALDEAFRFAAPG